MGRGLRRASLQKEAYRRSPTSLGYDSPEARSTCRPLTRACSWHCWRSGRERPPCTTRIRHDALNRDRRCGYTRQQEDS